MNVHHWKQKGQLYLWRYEPENKNYAGWHLSGDTDGLSSLVELIQAMESSGTEQYRTVNLAQPGEVQYQIPGCRSKPVPVAKLRVKYEPRRSSDFELLIQEDVLTLSMGRGNVNQYCTALRGLAQGKNDVHLGRGNHGVWLW